MFIVLWFFTFILVFIFLLFLVAIDYIASATIIVTQEITKKGPYTYRFRHITEK